MKGSNGLLRSLEKRATELFVDDKNGEKNMEKPLNLPTYPSSCFPYWTGRRRVFKESASSGRAALNGK